MALTRVKPAMAIVPGRDDRHTRPRARGVYSKLPRSAARHDGARVLLGLGGTMSPFLREDARQSLPAERSERNEAMGWRRDRYLQPLVPAAGASGTVGSGGQPKSNMSR